MPMVIYSMSRDEARMRLQMYSDSGTPIHPDYARELYRLAEWELPDDMKIKPIELTQEQKDAFLDAERYMFEGKQP